MIDEAISSEVLDAIESGNASKVRDLLTAHPQLIHLDSGSGSWIHDAVFAGNVEVVNVLLELGIDVDVEHQLTARATVTPLQTALNSNNVPIVKLLLERGANPNQGRQIISAITGNKNSLVLVTLLEKYGADLHKEFVNEQTGEMMNALSTAIDWGKEDVADYLWSRGCVMPGQSHQAARPATPKSLDDEIVEFFRNHFGPFRKQSLVEIVPTEPAIAVHVIPASRDRNRVTLFTTGMSSLPMKVGDGDESFALGELFIELPGDWPYQQIDSPEYGWPIHWLRWLAKAPHQHNKALGPSMIVTRSKRPQPIEPGVRFDGMLLLAEQEFVSNEGQTVRLYRMTPLYPEERKLGQGNLAALMRAFDAADVSFVFSPDRPNVAARD